jgi:hypothetical protein
LLYSVTKFLHLARSTFTELNYIAMASLNKITVKVSNPITGLEVSMRLRLPYIKTIGT